MMKTQFPRRSVVAGLAALPALSCINHGAAEGPVPGHVTVYAPAPVNTPLHALNLDLERAIVASGKLSVSTEAIALPESVNRLAPLPKLERRYDLPIMTSVDWPLAREGSGPAWHGYPLAVPDLLFVSRLYDVGFGIQVFAPDLRSKEDLSGRKIAAPPRPSAVRMLTEMLLSDGWGLGDRVSIVDSTPPEAAKMLATGEVAAMSWNLALPANYGLQPMLPLPGARYLPVEAGALAAMNAANGLKLEQTATSDGAPLLSFAQGLAAWRLTPDDVVRNLLSAIAGQPGLPGLPENRRAMAEWSGLTPEQVHPAAARYYRSWGIG